MAALQNLKTSTNIIGRATEKGKIEEGLRRQRSELVSVYGRRRIGKTYLIREFYSNNIIFSFSGLRNGTRPDQIENFLLELREHTTQFNDEKPENWLQAFSLLI